MKRTLAGGLIFGLAVLGLIPAGAVAAPAPAWTIKAIPYTSALAAGSVYGAKEEGPAYLVQAYNVGGAPTSGEFTVTDKLPQGLLPAPGFPPNGKYGPQQSESNGPFSLSCSVSGRKITCKGGNNYDVGPGEGVALVIPLKVEESASGTLEDKASIEGGGAAPASTSQPTQISGEPSAFGFLPGPIGLYGGSVTADGSAPTQAGSHPYAMTIAGMTLPTNKNDLNALWAAGGGLRDATVTLPHGLVVDPAAAPKCTETELESELPSGISLCPTGSQVGTISLALGIAFGFGEGFTSHPIYNMVPPSGYPAELGFEVIGGVYVHLFGSVSSDGTFTLTAAGKEILAKAAIGGIRTNIWGVPSEASHDRQRGECLYRSQVIEQAGKTCAIPRTNRPYLTLPSSCGAPLVTSAKIDSWETPGVFSEASYESTDLEGNPVGIDGCSALEFDPTIEAKPTTDQGDSPSGLEFALHLPQHEGAEELATANLKDVSVKLPEGMSVNPSAASGLAGCSSAQIGLASAIGASPVRFHEEPASCPDAAKLGTAEITTPLLVDEPEEGNQLPHVLGGSVYLASPFDNPFGSLLGLYLTINDEATGTVAKIPGKVEADPVTGQLTASFAENPELPLEDVKLHLFAGSRSSLTTPLTCGTHTTTSSLVPWTAPEGETTHPTSSFETTGSCSASEAAAPANVSMSAGTASPLAGAFSPFTLRVSRPDGSQRITGIETTLPQGLVGKLAGLSPCPEAAIAQARSREAPQMGQAEIASPSCPASSQVGSVEVRAGSGITPAAVSGHAYLAGPYKGAPLSFVFVVPAVSGPFDLGVVTTRAAIYVNETDARIRAVADPLPTILDGIPLDVRSVEVKLDRPEFTLNPTSCEAMAVTGTALSPTGASAPLTNRFQVGGCQGLGFKPSFQLQLKGATHRRAHPKLIATLTPRPGDANVGYARVKLPKAAFLDNAHIGDICVKARFQSETCPASSVYGTAEATTPLLGYPLKGNVYLIPSSHKLPDLAVSFKGPSSQPIRFVLTGRTDSVKGALRNTFETAPDVPVSKFRLELFGGHKGLVILSSGLCKNPRAQVLLKGHNGAQFQSAPKVKTGCGGGKKRKKHRGR